MTSSFVICRARIFTVAQPPSSLFWIVMSSEPSRHERRLRGDWGTVPQNADEDGQCIRPPKFGEVVLLQYGCVAKYEMTKKRCHEGMFCSEIEVLRQEKGHIIWMHIIGFTVKKQAKDRQKTADD